MHRAALGIGLMIGVLALVGCGSSDDESPVLVNGTPDFAILDDPTIDDLHPRVSPSPVYEGSLVVVRVPIRNIGETSTCALQIDTQVTSDVPPSSGEPLPPFLGVEISPPEAPSIVYQSGATWWYESQFVVGAAGTYQYVLTLDPDHTIPEWSKANNVVTVTFTVNQFPTVAQ